MTEPVACAACLFGGGAGPGPQQQPLTAGKGNFQDLTSESPVRQQSRDQTVWWVPGTRAPPLWGDTTPSTPL